METLEIEKLRENILYIRGICKNRWKDSVFYDDKVVFNKIYKYWKEGISFIVLREAAKMSFNWSDFNSKVEDLNEKAKDKLLSAIS